MPLGRCRTLGLALAALLLPAVASADRAEAAGRDAVAPDPLTVTITANGLAASIAPGPDFEPGAPIAWAYDVTNAGAASLWALYLWHDGVGTATCLDRSLAPGETVRCTGSGLAESGAVAAPVQAWAWDGAGAQASGSAVAHYTGQPSTAPAPAVDLEAFVAGKDADVPPGPALTPGRPVTFRYLVTNTGSVPLWGVWVHDPARGTIPCPRRSLAPAEQMACAVRVAAVAGAQASLAEVRAADGAGVEVTDQDAVHYFGVAAEASIEIEALVEGFDGDAPPGPRVLAPGETITFTYVVTNTGGLRLGNVQVSDDVQGVAACPARVLAPGAGMVCAATTVARLGEFASTGRVTARSGAAVVQDSDPIFYHVRSEPRIHHLELEVTVNGREADRPLGPSLPVGRLAHFVYLVTYTGNNIVYNVTIEDPFVPGSLLACEGERTLATGQSLRCTAAVAVTAGQYASSVTVVSWDADGRRVTAEDWVHYYGMP